MATAVHSIRFHEPVPTQPRAEKRNARTNSARLRKRTHSLDKSTVWFINTRSTSHSKGLNAVTPRWLQNEMIFCAYKHHSAKFLSLFEMLLMVLDREPRHPLIQTNQQFLRWCIFDDCENSWRSRRYIASCKPAHNSGQLKSVERTSCHSREIRQ